MQKYNFFYIIISFSSLISYFFKQVGHKQLSYCFFNSLNVSISIKIVSHQQPGVSLEQLKSVAHFEQILFAILFSN
jgi:hypothetical protein